MIADLDERQIRKIQEFWDGQGRCHGADLAATNPDVLAKELEIDALRRPLDPALAVLEAGCGNGFNLFRLAKTFSAPLAGFDYARSLIEAAERRLADSGPLKTSISFRCGDILGDLASLGRFEQAFTDRCLINLPSLELQLSALDNLAGRIAKGGRLVLIESCMQGQEAINALRACVGLEPISCHWYNRYLDLDAFLERLPETVRLIAVDDFSSLYFVISRVFNAKLTPDGEAPNYLAQINRIAAGMPSIGNCGPLRAIVLEKCA